MINLNLLPEKEKSNLRWDAWRRLILLLGSTVLIGLGFFSLILIGTNLYLRNNLEKLSTLLSLHHQLPLAREIKEIEERLIEADKKLNQISEIKKRFSPKSFIIAEIASILPQGCWLLSLNIQKDGSVNLVGFAKERATLLDFKKSLEENKNISNLNFPIANLLKEKDIEFVVSFKMIGVNR